MAYSETEERLKIKGSEQITRDLKVNRDTFINNKLEAGRIESKGDLSVAGEIVAGDDVSIAGDLYVNGTEYISNTETAQTTDNYLVLRHNQTGSLASGEHSGVAVHNYTVGKTATITADKDGTWRVADNTETDNNYTNISYYDGTFYTGLTRTVTSVVSGMKTAFDEDELDESVYYNTSYYHFDGSHWYPVSLTDNKLTLGSAVTDSATITALNALTKADLVYFRTLTVTTINELENQPLLTRDEAGNLSNGQALTWDSTNQKAVGKTIDTTVTSGSSNLITSGAVNTKVTDAIGALDVASVGGSGKYIQSISETDGKISATSTTMDTTPTASSTKAVTSGGVKTYVDDAITTEVTNRNTAITNAINALDVSDSAVSGKYVSAVSETDGKITVTRATLPSGGVTGVKGNSESTYRTGNVNLTAANIGAATSTDITNAINALDVSDSAVSGKYVSAVSEANGKITVTRESLPDISLKMDKADPTGTGSFSLNRMAGTTVGTNSFAEGHNTTASGQYSHAEGDQTTASGQSSHAEGWGTAASYSYAHAEGYQTKSSNDASHAEGNFTTASGQYSHAEGYHTTASGYYSHAEGNYTKASATGSHAEGDHTIASGGNQHVQGKYNVDSTTWAFVIGGGTSNSARKNILAFDWDGNLHIFGDVYEHCNSDGTGGTANTANKIRTSAPSSPTNGDIWIE